MKFPAGVTVTSHRIVDGKLVLELTVERDAAERTVTVEESQGATDGPSTAAIDLVLAGDFSGLARELAPHIRRELDKAGRRAL